VWPKSPNWRTVRFSRSSISKVVETEPFKDEPYTEFGAGKHAVVADGNGRAHKVVLRDSWPGREFLLDYHADGKLSQAAGVYPGALWGKFPPPPER